MPATGDEKALADVAKKSTDVACAAPSISERRRYPARRRHCDGNKEVALAAVARPTTAPRSKGSKGASKGKWPWRATLPPPEKKVESPEAQRRAAVELASVEHASERPRSRRARSSRKGR